MRKIPATVKVIKHSDTKGEQPCVKTMQGAALVCVCNGETMTCNPGSPVTE